MFRCQSCLIETMLYSKPESESLRRRFLSEAHVPYQTQTMKIHVTRLVKRHGALLIGTVTFCVCFLLPNVHVHHSRFLSTGIHLFPVVSTHRQLDMNNTSLKFEFDSLPSAKHSKIVLINQTRQFNLGDSIHITITLRNRKDTPLRRGGDLVLAWATDGSLRASSAGSVTDHANGTYTAVLRALWTGRAVIKAAIACSKEGFELMYKYFNTKGASKNILCIFEARKRRQVTKGSSISGSLGMKQCNLTAENYGIPWFCERPKMTRMHCSDWTKVGHEQMTTNTLFDENKSEAVYYLRSISHAEIPDKIHITNDNSSRDSLPPQGACTRKHWNETWSMTSPTGFFHNRTWHLSFCHITPVPSIHTCFQNRRIILFGDSTVRQWFYFLFNKLELKFTSQIWNSTKWHHQSSATSLVHRYDLIWSRHGLPIYFGETNRGETRPVFAVIDQIPAGSTDILLIHLYSHFQYHHPRIVRRNLQRITASLKSLFVRSPNVFVAIKGPHYFSFRDRKTLGGMWGLIYDRIIKEEFRGLYDRVVFLDQWDMTVAKENKDVHPSSLLVKAMVDTFLSFACSHSL